MTILQFPSSSHTAVAMPFKTAMQGGLYSFAILLIALAYGSYLAGLPLEAFKDRANYLLYADRSFYVLLVYWSQGVITVLTNEPVWLLINVALGRVLEPEITLRFIIGLPASIVAYLVLRADPKNFIWLLLFLFLPQVIKNHIVHLRQGLAVSIFLLGWFLNWRPLSWFLLLLTPFIHASFFFVLSLLVLTTLVRKLRFDASLRTLLICVAGIVTCVVLGRGAQYLGARQVAEHDFTAVQISGLGFVFWSMMLLLLIFQGHNFMRQQAFVIGALVFYLTTYFFIAVSARIFESSLIILLLAGLQMNGWRRQAFITMIIAYGIISYALRLNQPWLGFAFI